MESLFPQTKRLADEHVELLGKRTIVDEEENFIATHVISVVNGMSSCSLCFKRFASFDFAAEHMRDKHVDKVEEAKWFAICFNAYLADPQRPCFVDYSAPIETTTNDDGICS